jgi:hypothetical protein
MLHPLRDKAEGFEKSLLSKVVGLEIGEDGRSSKSLQALRHVDFFKLPLLPFQVRRVEERFRVLLLFRVL